MATYSISELAHEFNVTPRALRFYEDQGLLNPTRQGTSRIYSPRDRTRLKLTIRGKRLGLSLTEAIVTKTIAGLDVREVGDNRVLAYVGESIKPTLEQLRALGRCLCCCFDDLTGIARHIAHNKVQLGTCDGKIGHGVGVAVNLAAGAAQRTAPGTAKQSSALAGSRGAMRRLCPPARLGLRAKSQALPFLAPAP